MKVQAALNGYSKAACTFLWPMCFIARGSSPAHRFSRCAKRTTNTGAYSDCRACSCGRRRMLYCGCTPSAWLGVRQAGGLSILCGRGLQAAFARAAAHRRPLAIALFRIHHPLRAALVVTLLHMCGALVFIQQHIIAGIGCVQACRECAAGQSRP